MSETRVAVVTGAASGIGQAVARRLADDGLQVVGVDVDGEALNATTAGRSDIDAVPCDIADPHDVAGMVEQVVQAHGRLDVVVNSAGITGPTVPTWELDPADWQRIVDVNLTGTFNVVQASLAPMRAAGWGRIVLIASIAGKEGNPNLMAYSATKAGVIGMAKSVAKELATEGILVNTVAPAVIRTPLNDGVDPDTQDYMVAKIPMGRLGEVDEVAELVAWLASERCSFSTGACYDLSGGRAVY